MEVAGLTVSEEPVEEEIEEESGEEIDEMDAAADVFHAADSHAVS